MIRKSVSFWMISVPTPGTPKKFLEHIANMISKAGKKRGVQYISCINDTGALLNGFNNMITNVKSGFQVK